MEITEVLTLPPRLPIRLMDSRYGRIIRTDMVNMVFEIEILDDTSHDIYTIPFKRVARLRPGSNALVETRIGITSYQPY